MNQWLVPLAAAIVILFYAFNVPVIVAVCLRPGGLGVGFGAFLFAGAARRAEKNAENGWKIRGGRRERAKERRKIARFILRRARIEFIGVKGVVGFSDAGRTALAYGALNALFCALPNAQADIRPDFTRGSTHIEAVGIVSVRLGHIMLAAAKYAAMLRKGRNDDGQASD